MSLQIPCDSHRLGIAACAACCIPQRRAEEDDAGLNVFGRMVGKWMDDGVMGLVAVGGIESSAGCDPVAFSEEAWDEDPASAR